MKTLQNQIVKVMKSSGIVAKSLFLQKESQSSTGSWEDLRGLTWVPNEEWNSIEVLVNDNL